MPTLKTTTLTAKTKAIQAAPEQAQAMLRAAGLRITKQRALLVQYILENKEALSPYQIQKDLKNQHNTNMSVMSIYRILYSFTEKNLTHYISKVNKFIACSHLVCEHPHLSPQFLICTQCQKVTEITLPVGFGKKITDVAQANGYTLNGFKVMLEIDGLCSSCSI